MWKICVDTAMTYGGRELPLSNHLLCPYVGPQVVLLGSGHAPDQTDVRSYDLLPDTANKSTRKGPDESSLLFPSPFSLLPVCTRCQSNNDVSNLETCVVRTTFSHTHDAV